MVIIHGWGSWDSGSIPDSPTIITKNPPVGGFLGKPSFISKSSAFTQDGFPQNNPTGLHNLGIPKIIICSKAWKQQKGLM